MSPTARKIEGNIGERCFPRRGVLREMWGKDVTHGKENRGRFGGKMLPTARRIEGDVGERCYPRQ